MSAEPAKQAAATAADDSQRLPEQQPPANDRKSVKVIDPRADYGLAERLYVPQILRGLAITTATFATNFFNLLRGKRGITTIQYPDEKLEHSPLYRGLHILAQREDGTPKCVACYMCSTACPADCIYIEAIEDPDPAVEKRPVRFDIDLSRCVFCGFCEEACPCEAIYMSSEYQDMPQDNFSGFIISIDELLNRPQELVERKKTAIKGRR